MKKNDFIESTIMKLGEKNFEELKGKLVGEYIKLIYLDADKVDKTIFSEKLTDWFYRISFKTGDGFQDFFKKYISDWDNVVDDRIIKESKRDGDTVTLSRAKRLYDRAMTIKKTEEMTFEQAVDYSRMMMTLYMAIINNNMDDIEDFEYSFDGIDIDRIIEMLKKEKKAINPFMKTDRFNDKDTSFVIATILYYYIKDRVITEG